MDCRQDQGMPERPTPSVIALRPRRMTRIQAALLQNEGSGMLHALNNWRLTRKMLLSFVPFCLVILSLGGTAVISNREIAAAEQHYANSSLPVVYSAARMLGYLREYRILIYSHMDAIDRRETAGLEQRIGKNHDNLAGELSHLSAIAGRSFTPDIAALKTGVARLEEVNGRILALSRQGRRRETLALLKTDGLTASHDALDASMGLMDKVVGQSAISSAEAQAFANRMAYLMAGLALFSIGFLAAVWRVTAITFTRPMTELSDATTALAEGREASVPYRERGDELGEIAKAVEMFRLAAIARQEADRGLAESRQVVTGALGNGLSAMAQGDLTAEVTAEFPPEMSALKTNFNDALARLREMIGSVSDSAGSIRTGSSEIAQATEDLARRTESNAASLEQTSAALVQIDGRLKATAKAASRTVERADQAIATVGGGRSIADEAVQAMERVRESATGIDSVIEGLDKIAFQTRVLAMNAAVEAGRAGDAGRGFAVVADLVSSLAMRAEEEAKRARDQLTVTQTDIVTAVGAVQRVDGALADISGDVGEVHTLLGGMASDNQAQSSALSQISVAISSMDQSTQQNAAMVEETSAAARNLTSEVTSLAEQATLFKVDDGKRHPVRKADKANAARPAAAPKSYVSPVAPLPVAAMASARGSGRSNGALVHAGAGAGDDWSDF
jgi:methyl-accepting chemotaxis protein